MEKFLLNGKWKIQSNTYDTVGDVPGSVYSALLQNGLMEDPFYRDNERKALEIMDEEFVRSTDPMTIIIDLASFPYGMDDKLAKEYNLKYYRELGIPGRYAPVSAGEIIAKTIINNILTREDLI